MGTIQSMRALVIVPEPGSEPVLVGERLRQHGFDLTEVMLTTDPGDPAEHGDRPGLGQPDEYDLVVTMGSTRSVYEASSLRWIARTVDHLRLADERDVPVLGVCFGAQALASALGGSVIRAERPQVGWHPLDPGDSTGLPPGPWMQWHYDRIDPPPDATVLAHDDLCVQAYTVRRSLGVQFHPEVTRAHLAGWVEMGGADELDRLGIDPDALLAESAAIEPDVTARTNRLVDWFLEDVAKL
jgi:GMP synthase-like glutamine amidotransferase